MESTNLELATVYARFDEALEIFKSINYKLPSLPQSAQLRIQHGEDRDVSKNDILTEAAFIYAPKKGAFLTKTSPIVNDLEKAIQVYKNKNEFFLTDEQVETALKNSVRLLGESIPTNRFKENEITAFAFEDFAEQYGNFLYELEIKKMPAHIPSFSKKSFARQICLKSLEHNSAFDSVENLFNYFIVCGVKK